MRLCARRRRLNGSPEGAAHLAGALDNPLLPVWDDFLIRRTFQLHRAGVLSLSVANFELAFRFSLHA